MLSDAARKALQIACPQTNLSNVIGDEIADAINSGGNTPAAHVANQASAGAITIALSTSNTYTDAAVNTAVNTALTTVITDVNLSNTKINQILAALQAAGIML